MRSVITENSSVRGISGRCYQLEKRIGDGGEGSVFSVRNSNLVAKFYKKDIPGQEQKLLYMVYHPLPNVNDTTGKRILTLAWPNDVLYDDNKKFIGFVMPKIEEGIEIFEIDRCCTSPKAKRLFPNYTWKLNVEVARNLAVAVNFLHSQNCIVGDMNIKNILVHADSSISILDTDSFDLTDPQTGTHFKCGVGTEDYLAPELQGGKLRETSERFTVHTDDFALAIHIFQLLMDDFHPFTCRQLTQVKHSAVANPRLQQICQGKSPFIKKYEDVDIPLSAPTLAEILPDYICRDFIETFDYTAGTVLARAPQRTTAKKWAQDLGELLRECNTPGKLIPCKDHFYLESKGRCGRCQARRRYEEHQNQAAQMETAEPVKTTASPVKQAPVPPINQAAPKAAPTPPPTQPRQQTRFSLDIAPVVTSIFQIYGLLFAVVMLITGVYTEGLLVGPLVGGPLLAATIRMRYFRENFYLGRDWEPDDQPWITLYKLWLLVEHFIYLVYALMVLLPVILAVTDGIEPEAFWAGLAILPAVINRILFMLDSDLE